MPTYDEWNDALIDQAVAGAALGSTVYLSINAEVLDRVGRLRFAGAPNGSWADDFCRAVRSRVAPYGRVELRHVRHRSLATGRPYGVGFLAATVLAAYQMADDASEQVRSINYFRRLRSVLGIPAEDGGRPPGLDLGEEEPIWHDWVRWLQSQGFLSSARAGEGPQRFISYPISQSILRQVDKERLYRLFEEKKAGWSARTDANAVVAQVRKESTHLTVHLRALLNGGDGRVDDIAQAVFAAFEDWKEGATGAGGPRGRNLYAGLYRTEDPFSGEPEYALHPRQPRSWVIGEIAVELNGQPTRLVTDRPGWFLPVGAAAGKQVSYGADYPVIDHPALDQLVLPKREFWILVPDPDNPGSGALASWRSPTLGVPFLLLCRETLRGDLERLREERLLEWSGEPRKVFGNYGWLEFADCLATAQSWTGVFVQNRELREALVPKVSLDLALSGGLRVPVLGGWLDGCGPQVTVHSFFAEAELEVARPGEREPILRRTLKSNASHEVPWPGPGDYLVCASSPGHEAQRLVKIYDWSALPGSPNAGLESVALGAWTVRGGRVETEVAR